MVCTKCNTPTGSKEKFCPKCGNAIIPSMKEVLIVYIIIGSIIFIPLIGIIYYFIFLLISTRFIIPILSGNVKTWLIPIIFVISIITSIFTFILTYRLFKKNILKKIQKIKNYCA